MEEENNKLSFSLQSISTLFTSTKAFINNKGDVDVGKIIEVTISEEGILKVKIKGDRTATVCMEQVFENAEEAYGAAIKLKGEQKQSLAEDINAMRGRIDNIRNPQE